MVIVRCSLGGIRGETIKQGREKEALSSQRDEEEGVRSRTWLYRPPCQGGMFRLAQRVGRYAIAQCDELWTSEGSPIEPIMSQTRNGLMALSQTSSVNAPMNQIVTANPLQLPVTLCAQLSCPSRSSACTPPGSFPT